MTKIPYIFKIFMISFWEHMENFAYMYTHVHVIDCTCTSRCIKCAKPQQSSPVSSVDIFKTINPSFKWLYDKYIIFTIITIIVIILLWIRMVVVVMMVIMVVVVNMMTVIMMLITEENLDYYSGSNIVKIIKWLCVSLWQIVVNN